VDPVSVPIPIGFEGGVEGKDYRVGGKSCREGVKGCRAEGKSYMVDLVIQST
jgi:hypothetical protein